MSKTPHPPARGRRLLLGAIAVCALLAAFGGTASAKDKVTLCHRVGGPHYVVITIAPEAAIAGHSANHPLDIIPAFTYAKGGSTVRFPGQNLNEEGVAILGNQCTRPLSSTTAIGGGDGGGSSGGGDGGGTTDGGQDGPAIALCHWHGPDEYHEELLAPFAAYAEHADHPRDIIPAFAYEGPAGAAVFDGQNLTEVGIAVLANGCEDPIVEAKPVPGRPSIDLVKRAVDVDGGTLQPGDLVSFTLVATNVGSGPAEDVVVTDAISAGTEYVPPTAAAVPGTAEVVDGHLVARVGEGATADRGGALVAGASATVSFTVRVDEGLPVGATILDAGRAAATDPADDSPIAEESNLVELPVDTPPVVPVALAIDPPNAPPLPGTELPVIVETEPRADVDAVTVCVQIEVAPAEGSPSLGTITTTCAQPRALTADTATRSQLLVRIPRRAAGRCIRLSTSVLADGFTPRERGRGLCVRRAGAGHAEPVTG